MTNFSVVYDACVLYPAPLRDFLMHLALTDLFRAKWTEAIHREWIRSVLVDRPDLTEEQLNHTKACMDSHVRDALVTGYEYLIPGLDLPDPDDRHVLAAAIRSGSSLIVTFNQRDFPAHALMAHDIEAMHPDDFIADLYDLNPSKVLKAAAEHRRSLKKPAKSVEDYLDTLLKQGLPETVSLLRSMAVAL